MERKIISIDSAIVDGKAEITTQTQETFSSAELNQLIMREESRKTDMKKQMNLIKAEYDSSTVRISGYQALLNKLDPKTDALPKFE